MHKNVLQRSSVVMQLWKFINYSQISSNLIIFITEAFLSFFDRWLILSVTWQFCVPVTLPSFRSKITDGADRSRLNFYPCPILSKVLARYNRLPLLRAYWVYFSNRVITGFPLRLRSGMLKMIQNKFDVTSPKKGVLFVGGYIAPFQQFSIFTIT